ncbi:uncharacterized protein LOC110400109 [Numida meleagris]|uniref:uncharacterized protein LOC110400109 n=1 Tax=Numida meleagris TaxID=8996 RepID=UPI000B3E3BC6|nr:uncharacterized protein LOC110400109 [Numida meleagris]
MGGAGGRRGAKRGVTKRGGGGRRASGQRPRSGLRGDVQGRGQLRHAVTREAARGPRGEGVRATGPGRRRGSVRTGVAALRSAVTALVTAVTPPSHLGGQEAGLLAQSCSPEPQVTPTGQDVCVQEKGVKDQEKEMVVVTSVIQGEKNGRVHGKSSRRFTRSQIQYHCCTAKDRTGDCVIQSPGSFPMGDSQSLRPILLDPVSLV